MDRNYGTAVYQQRYTVALRKESVDRNIVCHVYGDNAYQSLSARRAWIEISSLDDILAGVNGRSPQGERG